MGLSPEIADQVKLQAKKINEEREKESAEFRTVQLEKKQRVAKIAEGLLELDQTIAEDDTLRESLTTVLEQSSKFKIYSGRDVFCSGVLLAESGDQKAVMTSSGVKLLKETSVASTLGHNYYPTINYRLLRPDETYLEDIFSGFRYDINKLPNVILKAVLRSTDKK